MSISLTPTSIVSRHQRICSASFQSLLSTQTEDVKRVKEEGLPPEESVWYLFDVGEEQQKSREHIQVIEDAVDEMCRRLRDISENVERELRFIFVSCAKTVGKLCRLVVFGLLLFVIFETDAGRLFAVDEQVMKFMKW
ncbi:unnamed protein product [Vicia faba]|uniref:Uncharacterized protein n=1 Tax=Vicia faba TaxID=3906 RepID=A0AAV1BBR4_VICFA|nr:unnamed protein product [Vicia faba]